METWQRAARGASAGTLGTVVMSALMLAARRSGLLGRQPPQVIAERAVELTGAPRPRGPVAEALGAALHVSFGAGSGAAYALLPRGPHPVRRGCAFGLVVYLASYQGWVPVLGALPAASRDRRDRVAVMVVAHLVFGAVLGRTEVALRR